MPVINEGSALSNIATYSDIMAKNLMDNATAYLVGERDEFGAAMPLTDELHAIAGKKFAELLADSSFGNYVELSTVAAQHTTGDKQARVDSITTMAQAARVGSRIIFVETVSAPYGKSDTLAKVDQIYYSQGSMLQRLRAVPKDQPS